MTSGDTITTMINKDIHVWTWIRSKAGLVKFLAVVALIIVLILIYSFSFTVKSVLPDDLDISSIDISDKMYYLDDLTEENWRSISDPQIISSVMEYVGEIPLKKDGEGALAGGDYWKIIIKTLDGEEYQVRFSENEAVLYQDHWYDVKTTPFFWKGTDIYSTVCQLADRE